MHDEQVRERTLELVLRLLERGHLLRIVEVAGADLDARGRGARLRHLRERVFFVLGGGLHGRDQVGHEVGTALQLRLKVGELLLADLVLLDEDVVALAPGTQRKERRADRQKEECE